MARIRIDWINHGQVGGSVLRETVYFDRRDETGSVDGVADWSEDRVECERSVCQRYGKPTDEIGNHAHWGRSPKRGLDG